MLSLVDVIKKIAEHAASQAPPGKWYGAFAAPVTLPRSRMQACDNVPVTMSWPAWRCCFIPGRVGAPDQDQAATEISGAACLSCFFARPR